MSIAIQNSQDILFLALATATLAVAVFLCWSLFYMALSLRDAHAVLKDIRGRVERFWEVVDLLREKLQLGGAMFTIAAKGVKELAEQIKTWNTGDRKPKKKNK